MDKDSIKWILECCLLRLEDYTKEQLIERGASEKLADMGIKLCAYLLHK